MLTEAFLVPTLVVGGEHSFVVDKLESQLRRHGLTIAHHWEWKKKPKAFVGYIDVVFIVTDMVSHSLNDHVREVAAEKGVPIIYGCRKWATNTDRLTRAGFPERVVEEKVSAPPAETTPAHVREPPQEEKTMPPSEWTQSNKQRLRALYENIILETPDITNAAAFEAAKKMAEGTDIYVGKERPDLLAAIRKDLGIVRPNNTYAPSPKETPFVSTVPTSEFPPEVLAFAPPRSTSYRAVSSDLRDLVRLLRESMVAENIESLTITASSVKFRRLVIEEGDFDV